MHKSVVESGNDECVHVYAYGEELKKESDNVWRFEAQNVVRDVWGRCVVVDGAVVRTFSTFVYVCIFVCVCVCIYIYIYMHTFVAVVSS